MATGVDDQELVDRFAEFFRDYYQNEIGTLARNYPSEQRSLSVDWQDLFRFDTDLADDYLDRPEQLQRCAEEALRVFDLPVDVKLGQAHVRIKNLPESTPIRELRARHVNTLVSVSGIVRKATDVRPKVQNAAFQCQRCESLTQVPQTGGDFQEPHECRSCERQGPFRLNFDQSEFVDAQRLRIQESPEGLRGGETPQSIDVDIEDDITGEVTPGDRVTATGILRLDQGGENDTSPVFDVDMEGISVEIEDEEFEDMNITEEDKREIVELSNEDGLYERMVDAMAPTIHGYRQEKLAMVFQLFSGVTKHLPDGSRIRGDLHMLLIGDPGTGKCVAGDTHVTLADGTEVPIKELVEANLDDPKPVDDGVYDEVDIELPSMTPSGRLIGGTATKVWKREAPERLYRIQTAGGTELEVTPSHPLFVPGTPLEARTADSLQVGDRIVRSSKDSTGVAVRADGGTAIQMPQTPDCAITLGTGLEWDEITSIEAVDPDDEWVYDLEVEGTHSYLSNGVVSHNSQMLQYIRNIAPRSVYTSGKGSSSAGLCVTGDTLVQTEDGLRPISELVEPAIPEPVSEETAADADVRLATFDREAGSMDVRAASKAWRMPEKPCRRIETTHGKTLEASVNTPVLVCGDHGIEWQPISEIEAGDHVAVPRFQELDRSEVPLRELLELDTEKVRLSEQSIEFVRTSLVEEFGTLRDAAAELDLSEDFTYLYLKNRHVPLKKLDRILDAIGSTRSAIEFDRSMVRHGNSITLPETFDEDLMYLLGLVFGDGDIALNRRDGNRGMIRLSNGDEDLLQRAASILEEKFDVRPEIERQNDRVPCIRVSNVTIARLFANAGMSTPKDDLALEPKLTTAAHADAFLRGLMDADGSVSVRDNGGCSVLLSTISGELAEQVQLMLETCGVRASVRERDRRGTYELDDGRTIESNHTQHFVEIYGADIDRYADAVGFECSEKRAALNEIAGQPRRQQEKLPIGNALVAVNGPSRQYYQNVVRGDNPGRARAHSMLDDIDLGSAEEPVREAVDADLRWDEVKKAVDTGQKEVFDLTVPDTHNFVANGIVTHNTAAAVRDDFGDGQQWTLEAGALVLADQGVAAVDELDKMRCVTGDTLVRTPDGATPIKEFASEIPDAATVELLENGRTIRGVDATVYTMTEDGRIDCRDVTAVHEYDAPDGLIEVTTHDGHTVLATPDHPFFVSEGESRRERAASNLDSGDRVYAPAPVTDGEVTTETPIGSDITTTTIKQVRTVHNAAEKVYDLTVEDTHNFVANGLVIHNSEDRSAMHEALEQQSISVSKAGINATLKSRCSLLGAANPKYGRFDQYESIGEQIDLEPALISRFDLIFTVTDQPDEEKDAELADHILTTNYAGELNTQREEMASPDITRDEVEAIQEEVEPAIDPELLRKYVAYSQQNCHPRMTDAAQEAIRDFYVNLRAKGADEDAPVPVTARKLEALVRLAEASARIRLADEVTEEDANRVIDIVRSSLQDIGVDPETGQFDADVVETGTSKSQRDRIKNLKGLIEELEAEYEEGVPVDVVVDEAADIGLDRSKAEGELEKLKQKGEVYEPRTEHVRTT